MCSWFSHFTGAIFVNSTHSIYNPKLILVALLQSFMDMDTWVKTELPDVCVPS